MAVADMTSGPLPFVRQWHKHSTEVGQSVELVQPLVDALLAQDHEKMGILHGQMSGIAGEADQIKHALYDQIKDMHFRSAGGYAFSQYVSSQDKVTDAVRNFADLLIVRKTPIPAELRADFQALVAQVVGIGRQMANLAKEFSSSAEAAPTDRQAQDVLEAIAGISAGSHQTRKLEMELAQHLYGLEKQLAPLTILFLDKYRTALREIAAAAESAMEHLRLIMGQ